MTASARESICESILAHPWNVVGKSVIARKDFGWHELRQEFQEGFQSEGFSVGRKGKLNFLVPTSFKAARFAGRV